MVKIKISDKALVILFFLISAAGVYAAIPDPGHNGSGIWVSVYDDGYEEFYEDGLQDAIDGYLLIDLPQPSQLYAEQIPDPGHGVESIRVSVDGAEMTLQEAIATVGLCGSSSNPYSSSTSSGHFASEIGVVINSVEMTLQEAIDSGAFCPIAISTCAELQNMNDDLYNIYYLTQDIDCSETKTWNWDGSKYLGFEPIGWFNGKLDGKGYKITNLFINRSTWDDVGLFERIDWAGRVTNVSLEVDITGDDYIGGLAGGNYGRITKSYSTGSVRGGGSGGDGFDVGGLVGDNMRIINESCSTATVSGTDFVGGLVGWADDTGSIINSYATGNVIEITESDGWDFGGLVGEDHGNITNCYSTGYIVVGAPNEVGGLVGYYLDVDGGIITNSFWDTQTSGQTISDGGVGKTTAEMKTEATFTSAGWDFVNIWAN